MVGMIDRQSRLLVKLIDDLMDVSRIATGKVVLQKVRLDLRAVLEAALEGGQNVFDASRHDDQAGPACRAGLGDRRRQRGWHRWSATCSTTRASTRPDGGRITVALTEQDGQAVVRVVDNGVGIASELLEQVFEMFTQVDRTLDRARGGLGIGLSLVRRLAELHGGTVTAQSDGVGRGSTFTVALPLATSASIATSSHCEVAHKPPRVRVLVVDDNKDVADGLAALLEFDKHEIRIAYDGASAIEAAAQFTPDVVFCDIGMPGMSGHELAARLRSDPRHKSTVLVAVTGWGNEDDRRLSVEAGFDLHFTKPISAEQVESVLARF